MTEYKSPESFEPAPSYLRRVAATKFGYGIFAGFAALVTMTFGFKYSTLGYLYFMLALILALSLAIVCARSMAIYVSAKFEHQKILSDMDVEATKELTKAVEKLESNSVENDGNKEE